MLRRVCVRTRFPLTCEGTLLMELLLSGQTHGLFPGGQERQWDRWQKVPKQCGQWSDGDPRPKLQHVPQVKLGRIVGLQTEGKCKR